jgi:hypothetical protein
LTFREPYCRPPQKIEQQRAHTQEIDCLRVEQQRAHTQEIDRLLVEHKQQLAELLENTRLQATLLENTRLQVQHQFDVKSSLQFIASVVSKGSKVTLAASLQRWKQQVWTANARVAVHCLLGFASLSNNKARCLGSAFARWKAGFMREAQDARLQAMTLYHHQELDATAVRQQETLTKLVDASGLQADHFAQFQRESTVTASVLCILSRTSQQHFLATNVAFQTWRSGVDGARWRDAQLQHVASQRKSSVTASLLYTCSRLSKQHAVATNVAFQTWRSRMDDARRRDMQLKHTMSYVFALASKDTVVRMQTMGLKRWQGFVRIVRDEANQAQAQKSRVAVRCILGFAALSGTQAQQLQAAFARWKTLGLSSAHAEALNRLKSQHQETVAQLMAEDAALNDAHAEVGEPFVLIVPTVLIFLTQLIVLTHPVLIFLTIVALIVLIFLTELALAVDLGAPQV